MKHLYFSVSWLLLVGALLGQLAARAQGLELFTLTRADSKLTEKMVPAPPEVPVYANSFLQERSLKLRLAEVAPKPAPSEIPRLQAERQQAQNEVDAKAAARDAVKNKLILETRNLESKDYLSQPEYIAAQKIASEAVAKRDALDKAIERKAVEESTSQRNRTETKAALQRQLNVINDAYLTRLRVDITKRDMNYEQALKSHTAAVNQIRAYENKYWDSIPQPELVSKDMREADKAHWQFYRKLTKLETQLTDATVAYDVFERARDSLTAYTMNVMDTSATSLRRYDQHIQYIQDSEPDLIVKLDTLQRNLTSYNLNVTKWKATFKAAQDKKTASDNNLTALPALTSIKGSSLYIPAVSVIGSHRGGTDASPTITSIKLFTALGSTANDVRSKRGTERLFIADASTFGFSADAALAFTHAARKTPVLGVVLGASYLDKLMTPDTLTSFTTGVFTARISLEYYVIADVLMVYGGFNSLSFLTERDRVTNHFTTTRPKDVYGFANAGVRAILKPGGEKSGVSFLFDLGFVLKGDNVKTFVPNDDFTITTIRATVAKNFALR
ncbi:hypothetical protein [Hymenobacter sp. BT559]|uniref:hypothetical protein n=1 Tax=Hymenobacter sp. BT559 TaxID=2795729 RepID=UPI0018ED3320|nr:hypothetical protein [Hymenobacter sp. BT559]MBJ6146384.1 hypothetical protein [Hymenobacter sp. BT559]